MVNAEIQTFVLILDKNSMARKLIRRWLYLTSSLQFVHLCFEHSDLLVRNAPIALRHRFIVADVDRMIDKIRSLEIFCAS